MNMKINCLLKMTLSLSALMGAYSAYAAHPYQASIIANCTEEQQCPLLKGDILSTSERSRSGLPFRNGMLFLGANTDAKVVHLSNHFKSFYLLEGTLSLRIFETRSREVFEIKSGKLTISMRQAGYYRVSVSPNGRTTQIQVISGNAVVKMGKYIQTLRKGDVLSYQNNQRAIHRKIMLPLYDEQYYFTLNFMHGYYHHYPKHAPRVHLRSDKIQGPSVNINHHEAPVILDKAPQNSHQSIIIRDKSSKSLDTLKHQNPRPRPKRDEPEKISSLEVAAGGAAGTSAGVGNGNTATGSAPSTSSLAPSSQNKSLSTPSSHLSPNSGDATFNAGGSYNGRAGASSNSSASQPGGYPNSKDPVQGGYPNSTRSDSTLNSPNPIVTSPTSSLPDAQQRDSTMPNSMKEATMPNAGSAEENVNSTGSSLNPPPSNNSSFSDPKAFEPRASELKEKQTKGVNRTEWKTQSITPQDNRPKTLEPLEMRDPPVHKTAPIPDSSGILQDKTSLDTLDSNELRQP